MQKLSNEYPFVEMAIVIVNTERGVVAVCNGQIIDEHPYPYSAYRLLLEYQNADPNLHVSIITKPLKYSTVVRKCREYLHRQSIDSPLRPLAVYSEPNQLVMLTPPVRGTKSNVMSKAHETKERVIANSQSVAIGLTQFVFGTAHFVLQSAADITCYTEAKIINAIGSHQETVEEIMAARRAKTKHNQELVLTAPARMKAKYQESIADADWLKRAKMKTVHVKTA